MSRRGRPPKVTTDGDSYTTKVNGKEYRFRSGSDGRLRALGTPDRDDDFNYARDRVAQEITKEMNEVD